MRSAFALRSPVLFSGAFLLLALIYLLSFNVAIRTDADAAQLRFDALMALNAPKLAAKHGERAIRLREAEGVDAAEIAALKARVSDAQFQRRRYARSATLLREALMTDWSRELDAFALIDAEDKLARAYLAAGELQRASAIYASFLDLAGDAATLDAGSSDVHAVMSDPVATRYAARLRAAGKPLLRLTNYAAPAELRAATPEQVLASADHMADLGGYFAMISGEEYTAAGLLATAYQARAKLLGGDHQDTVQLTLILGPLYSRMGRLGDAERLYLDAFHAQERAKGANSPDLSLYIKLLAGVYEKQDRFTEAQALYEHMRGLFRDAFGAQRYAANREDDRKADVNRPVSQYFPLAEDYVPSDLVSAAEFFVPTAKTPHSDEMKLREALTGDGGREESVAAQLAQLIALCRSESGESISLRSGYRSFRTQAVLFENNGDRGTVAPPGMSEHQTGLAADINVGQRFMRQSDRAFQCFEENAFRYGFILSYPPGNDYLPGQDTFEPWHWRFVGVSTAQLYREAGPINQPQEFLAALPCYAERAASGVFPNAGEPDICLDPDPASKNAIAESDAADRPIQASTDAAPAMIDIRKAPKGAAARILNDAAPPSEETR